MPGLLDQMMAAELDRSRVSLSHKPQRKVTAREMADAAQAMGLLAAPLPVIGDVAGLLGDAAMYAAKPEERTLSNAALTAFGALPFVPSAAGKAQKVSGYLSRSGKIKDAPNLPQRPFESDFKAASGPYGSPLSTTIEGHPLTADFVAGRRTVGGADQGLSERDISDVAKALGISRVDGVPRSKMPDGAVGAYTGGVKPVIRLASDLMPEKVPSVFAHEVGHHLHEALPLKSSGSIDAHAAGFRRVYQDQNVPMTSRKIDANVAPERYGYKGSDVNAEYWADALRAYIQNPNYIKSTAPKLAKELRDLVNNNPQLRKTIQLNQAAPAVGAGLLGGGLWLTQEDGGG